MIRLLLLTMIALAGISPIEAKDRNNKTLSVDQQVSQTFAFQNDDGIKPKAGTFALRHYVLMSNEAGERWAVLTLENTSSGSRTLEQAHIMALFADGKRLFPRAYSENFKGSELKSITINFGPHKFPILSLHVDKSN